MGLADRDTLAMRIDQAIERVLTNQASNGSFGLWRAESGDFWLDAYVTDFLSRARTRGYDVPDMAFRSAMDNLRNRVNYSADFDEGGEDIAYALYVLAREGAASIGDLRYYADVKGEDFGTPLAVGPAGGGAGGLWRSDPRRPDVRARARTDRRSASDRGAGLAQRLWHQPARQRGGSDPGGRGGQQRGEPRGPAGQHRAGRRCAQPVDAGTGLVAAGGARDPGQTAHRAI